MGQTTRHIGVIGHIFRVVLLCSTYTEFLYRIKEVVKRGNKPTKDHYYRVQ
jgi:hypothetical protein